LIGMAKGAKGAPDAMDCCSQCGAPEPSAAQLFQHDGRVHRCRVCSYSVRQEDFSEQRREVPQMESEAKVRRQICEIYCKSQEDIPDAAEYSEYLREREDLIERLACPISAEDVRDVWQSVHDYKEQNRDQLQRAHGWEPRKSRKSLEGRASGGYVMVMGEESGPSIQADAELAPPSPWRMEAALLEEQPAAESPAEPVVDSPQQMQEVSGMWAPDSPSSPPFLGKDNARHMSGGGQSPNTRLKKARYFFFADLVAGSKALAAGA